MLDYKDILPKDLNDYPECKVINNLKKIEYNKNIVIYGKNGYGKSYLKQILIKEYEKKNNFIKKITLDLDDDLKKNIEKKNYILNILKLSCEKLFIIDNISYMKIETQNFIKSIIKNYNKVNFLICLDNMIDLIESFHSLFFFFKLDDEFFNSNKNIILNHLKNKISKNKLNEIKKKSNNLYVINKYYEYIYIFQDEYLKYFKKYNLIIMNQNYDVVLKLFSQNLNDNIKYVNELLNDGYSENDIINFLINYLKNKKINNYNKILDIILKIDNCQNYSYIELLYIIKHISKDYCL